MQRRSRFGILLSLVLIINDACGLSFFSFHLPKSPLPVEGEDDRYGLMPKRWPSSDLVSGVDNSDLGGGFVRAGRFWRPRSSKTMGELRRELRRDQEDTDSDVQGGQGGQDQDQQGEDLVIKRAGGRLSPLRLKKRGGGSYKKKSSSRLSPLRLKRFRYPPTWTPKDVNDWPRLYTDTEDYDYEAEEVLDDTRPVENAGKFWWLKNVHM